VDDVIVARLVDAVGQYGVATTLVIDTAAMCCVIVERRLMLSTVH